MNLKKLKQIGISHSRLSTFLQCKRLFWYTINNWMNPNSNIVKNTLYGNLCHYILEHIQTFKVTNFQRLYEMCDQWIEKNKIDLDKETLTMTKTMTASVMFIYIRRWYRGEHPLSKNYRIVKCELELKRAKYGDHVFNLKIDKILQHKETKKLYILDHKCKSRFNVDIATKKISIDRQLKLYSSIFEYLYKKPISGIIHDFIKKPQLKMTKKEKTYQDYAEKIIADVEKRPDFYFQTVVSSVNDHNNKQFKLDLDDIMNDIYSRIDKGEKAFPADGAYTDACNEPFVCDFLDACCSGNLDLYLKRF